MALRIKKGFNMPDEGQTIVTIEGELVRKNKMVTNYKTGVKRLADILTIPFRFKEGALIYKDFFFVMDEGTDLGELVKAVNDGEIPDEVEDLEELLIGQQVGVEVAHNTSEKTKKVFANIVKVFSVEALEEVEEAETDTSDEDEDLELEEETEESGSEEYALDLNEEDEYEEDEYEEDPDDGGNFDRDDEDRYDRQNEGPDDDPDEPQPYKSRRKRH